MGADYLFFTEINIDGEWISIDPIMPTRVWNTEKHTFKRKLAETYWNGSRSAFGEAWSNLLHIMEGIKFEELSEDVQSYWEDIIDENISYGYNIDEIRDEIAESTYQINYVNMLRAMPQKDSYKNRGYVEIGTGDESLKYGDVDYLTVTEYARLSDDLKDKFEYREWDNIDSFGYFLNVLADRVKYRIEEFEFLTGIDVTPSQVRIIAHLSI